MLMVISLSSFGQINLAVTNIIPSSCGNANGSITVSASGGNCGGNYIYKWNTNPPQITATATNLAAGLYTVTVICGTDTAYATATVLITPPPTINITYTPASCSTCSNGSATANVTSGSAPYVFTWNNNEATQTIANVPPGVYCVTVTDINGCTATSCVTIDTSSSGISLSTTSSPETCYEMNGTASVTASGCSGVYGYLWSNIGTTATINNLAAGNYSVTVSCGTETSTANVIVNNLLPPNISISSITQASCGTCFDGSATITVNNGTPPYFYNWSNGLASQNLTYVTPGMYFVTVTDANGCSSTNNVTIVSAPIFCQAIFGYNIDTSNINTIDFSNYSNGNINKWQWNFGDNSTSSLKSPVHTYSNKGQYNVCLTAIDTNYLGNVICSDTFCNWVYVNNYPDSLLYSIHGSVHANGAATKAVVILFNTDYGYYNAVNYKLVDNTNNTFEFDSVKLGHYILWAIPDTIMSQIYLPTYYGDVLYWQNAYVIYVNANTYSVDIHLVPIDSASGHQKVLTGNGSVTGTVQFDNNLTYETNIFGQNFFGNKSINGSSNKIAGKNIPIYLKGTNGNILAWALANANGNFVFSNINLQDYTVNAEKASLQSISPVIPLTSTNPTADNILINIGIKNILTSVNDKLNYEILNSISYYPNPVNDNLNLVFNLEKQAIVDISIINITGQELEKYNYSLSEGSNKLNLETKNLSKGIYFIRINANNENVSNFKIVK